MMISHTRLFSLIIGIQMLITGCSGGGDPDQDDVSTNFPYLLSKPQVTFSANVSTPSQYDVTVTLEATGPAGVQSVDLWIDSKTDSSIFDFLELQYLGGNTWMGTTNSFLPLPSGDYLLDSIMIEDGDSFAGGLVRSGWYTESFFYPGYYDIDQRHTDWSTASLLEYNYGVSSIPVVSFTLP